MSSSARLQPPAGSAAGTNSGRPGPGPSTLSVHAGEARQKGFHSISDPVVCAATYTFENTAAVISYIENDEDRGEYGRYGNPNEKTVERKLAALEATEKAVLFASGMAAFTGLVLSRTSAGDEIVFFDECYHRSREFCVKHLARFGVVTRTVKTGNYDAMADAISDRTRLLISESPTNPHLSVIDIARFAELGQARGVETLIDATLATPFNLRPAEHGVTYVLHSATKYLGGHNDLLAGVVCGPADRLADVENLRGITGGISTAHNAWLLQRGLKTFSLRMERHNANGQAVAGFLAGHPAVGRVYYPGLESHPGHAIAARQMRGFGGLITFELKDPDWRAAARVVDAARLFRIGPSLGGVESLIEQPLVMSYFKLAPEDRSRFGIRDSMIRISCGIEDTADLIADLAQALAG